MADSAVRVTSTQAWAGIVAGDAYAGPTSLRQLIDAVLAVGTGLELEATQRLVRPAGGRSSWRCRRVVGVDRLIYES